MLRSGSSAGWIPPKPSRKRHSRPKPAVLKGSAPAHADPPYVSVSYDSAIQIGRVPKGHISLVTCPVTKRNTTIRQSPVHDDGMQQTFGFSTVFLRSGANGLGTERISGCVC